MARDISIELWLERFYTWQVQPSLTHSCGAILTLWAVQLTFEWTRYKNEKNKMVMAISMV